MGCTLASYHRDRCFGPVPGLRLLSRLPFCGSLSIEALTKALRTELSL
jgi:hypothetical protein